MGFLDIIAKVTAEAKSRAGIETVTIAPTGVILPAAPEPAAPEPAEVSKAAVNGGGGGITVRPWWDIFPKTPTEAVTRTLEEPVVTPAGGAAVVFKSITKQTGMRLLPLAGGAIGGFLFGRLFGGGGTQELQQELDQTLTQEPEVTVTPEMPVDVGVDPTIQTLLDYITKQQLAIDAGEYDIGAGAVTGDIGTSTITNITNTYPTHINIQRTITETYPTQITVTKTITQAAQAASQEATQEQGTDWITLALIGIAGLIGWQFLKQRA